MSNNQPKVCFVISGPNTRGGIERHVFDLSLGVSKTNEVFVLAHDSYSNWFHDHIQFRAVRLDRWRYNPLLLRETLTKIRQIQPDIVHAHGRKAAQVVSLLRRSLAGRRIFTVHNVNILEKHYKHFHEVIAVSSTVAEAIKHPRLFIIPNGCQ